MLSNVYLAGGVRTPFGSFNGALSGVSAGKPDRARRHFHTIEYGFWSEITGIESIRGEVVQPA